jgi:hypothetical protein
MLSFGLDPEKGIEDLLEQEKRDGERKRRRLLMQINGTKIEPPLNPH